MKRIGIFGGTFNPIHLGHIIIAQKVLQQLKLDKVIFVPCYLPPHKKERRLARARDRLKMVALAIKGNPSLEVSGWEARRKTTSYTVDTIKHFKDKFGKGAELFFIIGSDNLPELNKWKDIKAILQLAKIAVVNRPGHLLKKLSRRFNRVIIPGIDISSSFIRRRIALKRNVDCYLDKRVLAYIIKKKLYN